MYDPLTGTDSSACEFSFKGMIKFIVILLILYFTYTAFGGPY